jgi:DNA-binding response OmpR family regulator
MLEGTSSLPSSSAVSTNAPTESKRILIVDDEPDVTITFKMGLEGKGYKVDTFNDPEEALANFEMGVYSLLLLDIKMPKMNGFKLYEELEKQDKNVKVCFITAFEVYYRSLRELFPQIEIDCFIKKPIDTEELVKRIQAELQ